MTIDSIDGRSWGGREAVDVMVFTEHGNAVAAFDAKDMPRVELQSLHLETGSDTLQVVFFDKEGEPVGVTISLWEALQPPTIDDFGGGTFTAPRSWREPAPGGIMRFPHWVASRVGRARAVLLRNGRRGSRP